MSDPYAKTKVYQRIQTERRMKQEDCTDWPDTHEWSKDDVSFDGGRGMTRYFLKCGMTAVHHSLRVGP